MSRIAHHRLRHQTEIANACAVRGQRRLKSHLQRRGGGVELRRAANAADARRDDERVFRIAPEENLLKAAVHRAHAPGVGDRVVVDLQLDFEVTFDTIQIHLDNSPGDSPILRPRRTISRMAKIPFRIAGAPVVPSSAAPPGGTAACSEGTSRRCTRHRNNRLSRLSRSVYWRRPTSKGRRSLAD